MPADPTRPSALSEPRDTAGALAKAFGALGNPAVLWVIFAGIALTLLALAGMWKLMEWLLTGYEIFRWGWANWLIDTFTGLVIFIAVLLTFPAVLLVITSMFLGVVVRAVEGRHYPHLPPDRDVSIAEDVIYGLKFLVLIILVNLVALPFYIMLPGINFLLSWVINGYITGREYFELVAMRRMGEADYKALRRRNGGRVFRSGVILAMLMTVPFLNLLMPVVAAAYMTHIFHTTWRPGDTPEAARG